MWQLGLQRMHSSEMRFALPCAHPDFFASKPEANRLPVHCDKAGALHPTALHRTIMKLFAATAADETMVATDVIRMVTPQL